MFYLEFHIYGASHADDITYNFDFSNDKCAKFTDWDLEVANTINTFWANFAKTGNPNGNNVSKKYTYDCS